MKRPAETLLLKNGKPCLLRSAEPEDARQMIAYMKIMLGETPYLLRSREEFDYTPEEEIINDEVHERLMGFIDELPSLYKDVMIKYMIEELEYEEIAKELDLELNTVRTRIRRGKQHLAKMMVRGEVE